VGIEVEEGVGEDGGGTLTSLYVAAGSIQSCPYEGQMLDRMLALCLLPFLLCPLLLLLLTGGEDPWLPSSESSVLLLL
jgi:hypothetical protein